MDPRIRTVLRMVEEQSVRGRGCSLETATMFGLSKEYLLRLFKKEVGVGFSTYSTQARMTLAAEMLASQSLPTKAVALALGYSDVANFHRDFKRAHGMTPRQWRLEKLVSPIPMNERRSPAAMSVSDPKAGTA